MKKRNTKQTVAMYYGELKSEERCEHLLEADSLKQQDPERAMELYKLALKKVSPNNPRLKEKIKKKISGVVSAVNGAKNKRRKEAMAQKAKKVDDEQVRPIG